MDLVKFFGKNLELQRQPLQPLRTPSEVSDGSFIMSAPMMQDRTYLSGKDYARKYVEQENQIALEAAKVTGPPMSQGKMDEISVGTVPTNVTEIVNERAVDAMSNFNFQHRSQENLPIFSYRDEIVKTIQTHAVTIIEGSTGCGKSTQVPQFILDSYHNQKKFCNIVVCQPRRIAALSIATRVAQERKWKLGSLVGCQVGMYKNTSQDTRLTYCTTGILLRKLISTKNMLDFTHVILDEVHERDQEMDFLILVIRKLLRSNSRSTKVILMSATFNVDKFANYFAFPTETGFIDAPVVSVSKKRKFKIHTHYLCQLDSLGVMPEVSYEEPKVTEKMIQFCVRLINIFDDIDMKNDYDPEDLEDNGEKPRPAVLVFLPGIWEIEEMHSLMHPHSEKSKWDIVVLHSSITNEEQSKVFTSPPRGYRRIILSTNIAESSITIQDVRYVIDFCLTKQLITDPSTNFQCLELTWASKANCDQRAGRAGRVMDGRVYRLVSKKFYEEQLQAENEPEIARSPLDKLVLQTKLLDMGEPKAVLALAIDPPDLSNLERTVLLLKEVGGLVDKPGEVNRVDGHLTDLGKIMANLPVDVHLSKLMALGHAFNVLRDTIIMAASMALKSMFSNPFQKRMEAYKAKVHWADGSSSDSMAFLNAYRVWQHEITANRIKRKTRSEQDWAKRNFIQIRVMHEVDYMVGELTQRLERLGIKETTGLKKLVIDDLDRSFVLKIVIAGAFYPNYFIRSQSGYFENDGTYGARGLGGLDPTRTVYLQGWKMDHPGKLYAKRIQELFKDIVPSHEQALVEFDGSSRIYIMFSDEKFYGHEKKMNEMPGKISPSVYKALKMRKLGMEISVPVLDVKSAKKMAEKLDLPTTTCSMFYSQDNFNALKKCLPKTLPNLPDLSTKIMAICIVNFIDPGKFWVHLRDNRVISDQITKIRNHLNDPELTPKTLEPVNRKLKVGELVAAPWKDQKVYRAVVESFYEIKKEDVANLLYIDFGYRCSVRCANLQLIKETSEIATIKGLALECTLTGIEPSRRKNAKGKWCREAVNLFRSYAATDRYVVYGEIYSIVDSVISIVLMCQDPHNRRNLINLNDELEREGLADPVEENYLSKYNHQLRTKGAQSSAHHRQYLEFLQYDKNFLISSYPDPPPVNDCNFNMLLKGPNSPLEINLSSLAIVAASKSVVVEGGSVNSVLVDTNPEDPHDRLLVSSLVSQNQSSTTLTLRNTTLMPNIPGLTALLCLIFTPKMELRRSSGGTYYVGALCGLGYDPKNNAPLLPEHDMEVCFDTEVSIQDLQNINRLRHWINLAINIKKDENDNNEDQAIFCQKKVYMFLTNLTDHPTKSQQKQKILNFGGWNMYDDSLFIRPTKSVIKDDSIYPLHNALSLEDRNEIAEEMFHHIKELRQLAMSISDKIEIECKLCEEIMYTREDLRLHLFLEKHRNNESKLNLNSY
ncbi:probable ATP-dependent RNA helicase spindle-E isoform X2 [Copidosoma floridanum]|uniref:probable ATP-dependent RNA helicase spindle-E isoform X2 n=1 Tax=Copidosoma floridanum TaxID=29053 RepID=UPI0006C9AB7F|nr:probable ATP-dependent RNA helicase spindle-E isoform X2 [Copidosoma floridanum]